MALISEQGNKIENTPYIHESPIQLRAFSKMDMLVRSTQDSGALPPVVNQTDGAASGCLSSPGVNRWDDSPGRGVPFSARVASHPPALTEPLCTAFPAPRSRGGLLCDLEMTSCRRGSSSGSAC